MSRVVIVHPEMGIFIGQAMGLAFWSNQENAGQDKVTSFVDEADARDFLSEWDGDHSDDIAKMTFHTVEAEGPGITIDELKEAGLEEHLGELIATHHAPGMH